MILISVSLLSIFSKKPAIAQVAQSSLQTVAVATAAQPTTDEATQKKIDGLIAQLGDENASTRMTAVKALVKIGQPAVQPLIKALGDIRMFVRRHAAWALLMSLRFRKKT